MANITQRNLFPQKESKQRMEKWTQDLSVYLNILRGRKLIEFVKLQGIFMQFENSLMNKLSFIQGVY